MGNSIENKQSLANLAASNILKMYDANNSQVLEVD